MRPAVMSLIRIRSRPGEEQAKRHDNQGQRQKNDHVEVPKQKERDASPVLTAFADHLPNSPYAGKDHARV